MSRPVTHGELRAELSVLEQRLEVKLDQKFDQKLETFEHKLDQKLDKLEHKFDQKLDQLEQRLDQKLDLKANKLDLDLWGGALKAYIETSFEAYGRRMAASEERVIRELARHVSALDERHRTEIAVVDDKYKDLPDRVARLEAAGKTRED